MSDHIPLEIQMEIMARLPVKSLMRFRSVSKPWKSLIDRSAFIIKHYSCHHTQVHHLLVKYDYPLVGNDDECEEKYVSIVDDHTFPNQKVFLTLPPSIKKLICPRIIGGSHGLVGVYSISSRDDRRTDAFVLWNITIRKTVDVSVPNVRGGIYGTAIGFGVCRETNDLKIVKITYLNYLKTKGMESFTPEVEVFTLSTRAWRRSYGNLPRKSIHFCLYDEVVIDGVFYWLANDMINMDGFKKNMIISFDITTEEFKEVTFPDSLAHMGLGLNMSKLGESLVVVGQNKHAISLGYEVWMMGDGVPTLFMKLFTFTPAEDSMFTAFRKSGVPILDVPDEGEDDRGQLVVYDPYSKCIDSLGIDGFSGLFIVYNYMETLLLHDQPNLMVYNDMKAES